MLRSRLRSRLLAAALALLVLPACHRHHRTYVEAPPPPDPGMPPPPPPPPQPHVLSVTGGGQALSRVTSDPVDEVLPAISPKGDVLLFEARVLDEQRRLTQQTIVGVDPETGARRTLYTSPSSKCGTPGWLPDGSSFVYASDSSGRVSLVRSLAAQPNAAVSVIVGGDAAPNPGHPSLSPDGKRIAFHMEIRGTFQIGVAGTDGSRLTLLGEGMRPSWSPDGQTLVFTRRVNGVSQLFLINPDTGTNLVQVTNDPSDNDNAAWSPGGHRIVFNSNRGWERFPGARRDRVWNLYLLKPDGTGLVQLTDGDSDSGAPSWSHDGWIYFSSDQAGGYDIWRLRPAGGGESR